MPEKEKQKLESNGKFVKEIYFDRELVDKFWIDYSSSEYGKPAKAKLGTLILKESDFHERVILLMGSDCSTEDLMMEGEVISDGSDRMSFDDEPAILTTMVFGQATNKDGFDWKSSEGEEHGEENKYSQSASKEVEVENPKTSSDQDNKLEDLEHENVISVGNEARESLDIVQQYPGIIPYSGSISLRSTSSTASTQSFAFPILAQEWDSSPVRMAKPDSRQSRKQKHWKMKMSWICCKF